MPHYLLSVLYAGILSAADAPPAPAACATPCGPLVCVPEQTMHVTDKVIYDERCVAYCLPRCSLFSLFWGGGCGGADCGQPRIRHVLIKKIVHEERLEVKCEVRHAPCAPPCVPGP